MTDAARPGSTPMQDGQQIVMRRDEAGRWVKGVSGNPAGLSPQIVHVRELAREHTEAAIAALVEIATDRKQAAMARVMAADALLSRGWGRPLAGHVIMNQDDAPAEFTLNIGEIAPPALAPGGTTAASAPPEDTSEDGALQDAANGKQTDELLQEPRPTADAPPAEATRVDPVEQARRAGLLRFAEGE